MPSAYPGGGPRISVEALLKRPQLIARRLSDLTFQRFVADRVFARGTPEQVAGGAALFQRSESLFMDRDVEEVGVRAEYPRASWTEAVYTAAVRKFGLESPISDEARRRNAFDQVQRGFRKIANNLVRFVDTLAMTLLNDTTQGVGTGAGSGDWSTAATDIIFDIATAQAAIVNRNEGYEPDTLIVHTNQRLDLTVDADLRNALPREGGQPRPAVITGQPVPILGLDQIISTPQQTAGVAVVLESGMAGTIADEAPEAFEQYQAFNPGEGFATVWVKTYREENVDETIIRGARFPAMWLAEPGAVQRITGI